MKQTIFCLMMLGLSFHASAQEAPVIKGLVLDQNGNPLPGVSVEFKKTLERTSSDVDGSYELTVPENKKVLLATYQGYMDVKRRISKKNPETLIWMDPIKNYNQMATTRYWPRRGYVSYTFDPHSTLKEDGTFKQHSKFAFSVQFGYTFKLHKRPISHKFLFGLDWTFIDFSAFIYNNSSNTSASPYMPYYTPEKENEVQISLASMLGPSLAIAPFTQNAKRRDLRYLNLSLYYRVGPNFDFFDTYADGTKINVAQAIGASINYKRFGFGYERRWTRGGDFENFSNRIVLTARLGSDGMKKSLFKALRENKQRNDMAKAAASIQGTTKVIKGQVLDKDGQPVAGALVEATGGAEQTLTDQNGNFMFEVPKHLLSVTASAQGYKSQDMKVKPKNNPIVFKLRKK